MKILITGGHLAPALAVIDKISVTADVHFVGRRYSFENDRTETLEYQEIIKRNIPFYTLSTGRLQRKFSFQALKSLVKFPRGFINAQTLITRIKPDVILLFGGYLSLPIAFAAKMQGVPIIIHEQTLGAGLANKVISKFATVICVSWEQSLKFFPSDKTVLTGNPLKQFSNEAFTFTFDASDESLPLLYITGGSTGSHAINMLIEHILPMCLTRFRILHQTGDAQEFKDYERLVKLKASLSADLKKRYHIEKFIPSNHVGSVYKHAAIVISRSGINTITELIYFGKPAVLIPLPHGQKNEQMNNALFAKELGIAEILPQENATGEKLLFHIDLIMSQYEEFLVHIKDTKPVAVHGAADKIIHIVYETAEQKDTKKT